MKKFLDIKFDPKICRSELGEFRLLLDGKQELSERNDILPFFRNHHQLSALVGLYNPNIIIADRIAYEFQIFGDFTADMVVGDSEKISYCFIEFEDGRMNSIFVDKGRSTLEWSPRFDHGYSQIIDWFWKLDDFEKTDEFEAMFGGKTIDFMGILIIGRSGYLKEKERRRLKWRQRKLAINSQHIYCFTFDELYNDLSLCLDKYELAARADKNDSA